MLARCPNNQNHSNNHNNNNNSNNDDDDDDNDGSSVGTVDLLIGGIEASLWVAEQFAADLRNVFPKLNVITVSANKLLGLGSGMAEQVETLPNMDDFLALTTTPLTHLSLTLPLSPHSPYYVKQVYFPGTDNFHAKRLHKRSCVLLISQSGQTFPTLHATRALTKLLPTRVWILTGCYHRQVDVCLSSCFTVCLAD